MNCPTCATFMHRITQGEFGFDLCPNCGTVKTKTIYVPKLVERTREYAAW